MCGITGVVGSKDPNNINLVVNAINLISHRGPDSKGFWISNDKRVSLGHARLSIQDTSKLASQPMLSPDGKYVLIYNGEIYNKEELNISILRKESLSLRSKSDTEILLYSLIQNGVKETCKKIDGMFAFCFYDMKQQIIHLARDKFGEKPLFYSDANNIFTFASEIKALKVYQNYSNQLDIDVLDYYLRYGFIPNSESIFKHIKQLIPGEILEIGVNKSIIENRYRYSDLSINQSEDYPQKEKSEILLNLLNQSVRSRLVGDVPIGCFLSGGIDSSLIAALASKNHNKRLKTFSIGFKDKNYDESVFAKNIAKYLDTDHSEYIIGESELIKYVPEITKTWDQPFADSSQIPMLALCNMTSKEVKVCIGGDGADEIFGGYERYRRTLLLNSIPIPTRNLISKLLITLNQYIYRLNISNSIFDRICKINCLLKTKNAVELYDEISSLGIGLGIGKDPFIKGIDNIQKLNIDNKEILDYCMEVDLKHYLSEDILVKADRASMKYSLEVRSPFLNTRILDIARSYNSSSLSDYFVGKKPLRKLASKMFPNSLIQKKKKGFAVPLNKWLRGPLANWSYSRMQESYLIKENILSSEIVSRIYQENIKGNRNWSHQIWAFLIFEEWYRSTN